MPEQHRNYVVFNQDELVQVLGTAHPELHGGLVISEAFQPVGFQVVDTGGSYIISVEVDKGGVVIGLPVPSADGFEPAVETVVLGRADLQVLRDIVKLVRDTPVETTCNGTGATRLEEIRSALGYWMALAKGTCLTESSIIRGYEKEYGVCKLCNREALVTKQFGLMTMLRAAGPELSRLANLLEGRTDESKIRSLELRVEHLVDKLKQVAQAVAEACRT